MMIGKYNVFNPGRNFFAAVSEASLYKRTCARNFWAGQGTVVAGVSVADKSAIPDGYSAPHTIWLAPKGGAIRSTNRLEGEGEFVGAVAGGVAAVAGLSGSGDISNAAIERIAVLVAALSGSGTISDATLSGAAFALASIGGAGDLVGLATAKGFMAANPTGAGSLAGLAVAKGFMTANLDAFGTALSTGNVGEAVLGALVESGFDLKRVLRIIAAATAGKNGATALDFRDLSDTEDMIEGTFGGGKRTGATYGG